MSRSRPLLAALACLLASAALAGETAISLMNAGMSADCADYAANVSGSEGNFGSTSPVVNGVTCYGAFQFCSDRNSRVGGTFGRYYDGTPEQFLRDPQAQVSAWMRYQRNEWTLAQQNGLTTAIGQRICYKGECATLTQSSILKACQFGCGSKGKLANFVKAGFDCNAKGTTDGNNTSVCKYLISGSGYNVACITNTNDGYDC
jgi:hypothetical protein